MENKNKGAKGANVGRYRRRDATIDNNATKGVANGFEITKTRIMALSLVRTVMYD